MSDTESMSLSDEALRDLWRKHGGKFHGPKVETGTMPEADLFPFLRSLITADPLATRADGTIVDEREAKSERDRFETWMQCYHADLWPNADADGSRVYPDGTYRNRRLHELWEAWQAAQSPREVADRAQRIEFAATALGVVERRRDELLEKLRQARQQIAEQPAFFAVRGCRPGDVVFLIPGRELTLQEAQRCKEALMHFSKETNLKIGLLPTGFTVSARDEPDTCAYTPDPNYNAPGLRGDEKHFTTTCGKGWLLTMGRSLHPFCAWCGKPVIEANPSSEPVAGEKR